MNLHIYNIRKPLQQWGVYTHPHTVPSSHCLYSCGVFHCVDASVCSAPFHASRLQTPALPAVEQGGVFRSRPAGDPWPVSRPWGTSHVGCEPVPAVCQPGREKRAQCVLKRWAVCWDNTRVCERRSPERTRVKLWKHFNLRLGFMINETHFLNSTLIRESCVVTFQLLSHIFGSHSYDFLSHIFGSHSYYFLSHIFGSHIYDFLSHIFGSHSYDFLSHIFGSHIYLISLDLIFMTFYLISLDLIVMTYYLSYRRFLCHNFDFIIYLIII